MNSDKNVKLSADAGGPYSGDEGSLITFDGTGSNDPHPHKVIVSYEWDLDGDGEYDDATGPKADYTWRDDYSGSVGLRVTNNLGETDSDSTTIKIANVAPVVDAGEDENVETGEVVSFSGSFTDVGDDTWTTAWNFGDGETDSGTLTPTHEYLDEDVYSVTLTVSDDDGGVGTDTLTVTVKNASVQPPPSPTPTPPPPTPPSPKPRANKPPIADAGSDQLVCIARTVQFYGYLSSDPDGVIKSCSWSFGDGASASGVNVSHVYDSEGVYTATLTVTDNEGAADSDTCIITIVALTPDEVAALLPGEAAELLTMISPEAAVEILIEVDILAAAEILEEMNMTAAVDTVEAALYLNQTAVMSQILLEMEELRTAAVMIDIDLGYGVDLVESMMSISVAGCARRVESAVKLDLTSTAVLLEEVETDLLLELLIEITGLPSTPSTVAALFEVMSFEKTLEMVRAWVSIEALPELGSVLKYLTPETLNNIYGGLTDAERAKVYPYLSSENKAEIKVELLPLPDLTPILITVSKLERLGYTVTAIIKNQGYVDSGNLTVDLRTDSQLIDKTEIASLSAEASTTVTYEWRPILQGTYTLEVMVDPHDIVDELNETNNEFTTTYGVVLPDLTVSVKTVPTVIVEKKTYIIEVEVSNIGNEDTGEIDLTLETSGVTFKALWTSTTFSTSDVEQLAPGSSRSLQFSWTPEEAGAYTLKAAVDPQEKVLEGDETNNIDKVKVTIRRRSSWPLIVTADMAVISALTVLLLFLRGRILG